MEQSLCYFSCKAASSSRCVVCDQRDRCISACSEPKPNCCTGTQSLSIIIVNTISGRNSLLQPQWCNGLEPKFNLNEWQKKALISANCDRVPVRNRWLVLLCSRRSLSHWSSAPFSSFLSDVFIEEGRIYLLVLSSQNNGTTPTSSQLPTIMALVVAGNDEIA